MDAAVQQMRDQQQTQDLIDRQIVAHQHLHEDYTAQVTQLKQFAVQGFAQNNERIHAGLDNLLSSMQFSEAKINIDTGCDDNWISEDLLIHAGLMGAMEPVELEEAFVGFGGAEFKPLGALKITWFGINTSKSWKNHFLVHRDGPFDMVLGSTWIEEDSLLTFSQPALALRMTNFTKGKYIVSRPSLQPETFLT
ncbi:MAG: hypothetical protein Q9215_004175 [Flavoplaca cf. flavocitrina]